MDITGLLKVCHFLYPRLCHKISKSFFFILRGEKNLMKWSTIAQIASFGAYIFKISLDEHFPRPPNKGFHLQQ